MRSSLFVHVSLSILLFVPAAHANVPGGGEGGLPVTLTQAPSQVTLSNGVITAVIGTENARVLSLKFHGREMVQTAGRHQSVYFSMAGGASYEQPNHCIYSIAEHKPDHVDISCKRIFRPGDKQPWDIDIHYVLRSGSSGLYVYAIVDHPASYPPASMGEWRMVWWMPTAGSEWVMERIYVDELRHWTMPSPGDLARAEPTPIKEIVRLTTGPWAGRYDCKYAYSANYGTLGAYGHASDRNKVGAWIVLGGYDFFNDGPLKQDLVSAAGIIHLHLFENHYGAGGFTIQHGQAWKKIYGPWLLYCNGGAAGDALWADAKAQAVAEQSAWPYQWLSSSEYPPASERGTVTGRFILHDPLKPVLTGSHAWVGLALPEETAGNWQYQGAGYQYWTQTDGNGNFRIPAVRPGEYTLYAFTTGAVGEFSQKAVTVKAAANTDLASITWYVPHPGKRIAWEIGVPDRSAAEFKHGIDYFQPYLYQQFSKEWANPLAYDASKNNWATAWNYAHSPYDVNGVLVPWKWRIHFKLDHIPAGNATLTIAFAGSNGARMQVYVNDETAPLSSFVPANEGGNALLREGVHAKYAVSYIPIAPARLKAGANTITLVEAATRGAGLHVMYDYLNLELP